MRLMLFVFALIVAAGVSQAATVLVPDGACFRGDCCRGYGGSKTINVPAATTGKITRGFSDDKITVYVNGVVVFNEQIRCNPLNHAFTPNVEFPLQQGTNTIKVVASCPCGCRAPNGCIEFTYAEQPPQPPQPPQPACGNGKVEAGEECDGSQQVCTAVMPQGLAAYWKGEGNADDFSGNGNNGLLSVSGTAFTEGRVGQTFSFSGINSQVRVADSITLDITGAITISAWIKTSGTPANSGIVTKLGPNPNYPGYHLAVNSDNTIRCSTIMTAPWTVAKGTTTITDGQWHHVACTYDSQTIVVYVDGKVEGRQPYTGGIGTNTAPLYIGNDNSQEGRFFNGLIDEIAIYNRALSSDEINSLQSGNIGSCAQQSDPCRQLYGSESACQSDCKCSQPVEELPPVELPCGNGKIDPGEECDWNAPDSCGQYRFCYACVCRPTGILGYFRK